MAQEKKFGIKTWDPPTEIISEQYDLFSKEYDINFYRGLYGNHLSGLSDKPCLQFVYEKILSAVENRRPFSLIRVSDGEGNILFNDKTKKDLEDFIIRRISYIHFGNSEVVFNKKNIFEDHLRYAISTADIIGVPELVSIENGFTCDVDTCDIRAHVGNRVSAMEIAAADLNSKITVSTWINRHLLGMYPEILTHSGEVGLISCRSELPSLLIERFKVKGVDYYPIPIQSVFVSTKDRVDNNHYPVFFNNICEKLHPKFDGMVYLVAAGLLGKYYCALIKDRGGVAIDIGSVPEIWLGIPNRGLSENFINKWSLV